MVRHVRKEVRWDISGDTNTVVYAGKYIGYGWEPDISISGLREVAKIRDERTVHSAVSEAEDGSHCRDLAY